MQSPPPPPPPNPPFLPPSIEDGGHVRGRPKSPFWSFILGASHNITQLCIGAMVMSALFVPYLDPIANSFTQHIILCTVGYFVLMAQAVLSLTPYGCASDLQYGTRKFFHAALQIFGAILAIIGSIIRLIDMNDNFETGHAICGFIAMLLAFCSLLAGLFTLIFPKKNNNCMKILHSLIGSITLTFAFIALIFAFHEYYREIAGDRNANFVIVISVFGLVGTLLMAMIRNARRILNP